MHWKTVLLVIYVLVLLAVCLRVLFETRHSGKVIAYILCCIFVPVGGILFYLIFGINYWKKRRYNRKLQRDDQMLKSLKTGFLSTGSNIAPGPGESVYENRELVNMLQKDLGSPLTSANHVKILVNGEQKFPELMEALENARHHIHIEYYIFEYDETGTAIIELLIKKAVQGIQVRFIYDDFGSPGIKRRTEKRMRDAGISIHPFHKVHFYLLANRVNYRNHRKIVVIDGCTGFTGGINISDRYSNQKKNGTYWRDTHLRIDGPGVFYLQYIFIADWNFCCGDSLEPDPAYFPVLTNQTGTASVQIAAGGPDSFLPSILYSILQAIYLANKEILITTPYFIPGDSVVDALCVAALGGVAVKLLVPGTSDSKIVNAASKSNYQELLDAGVEVYRYRKGFIHAKTMVMDGLLTVAGTANMDHRSYELNFEVNAVVYDSAIAASMRKQFFEDLQSAEKIDRGAWINRGALVRLSEKLARLFSPVL